MNQVTPRISFIAKENIPAWFRALRRAHDRVLAPVRKAGVVEFVAVDELEQVAADYVQTTRSAKEALFPRTEALFSYRKQGRDVQVQDFDPETVPTTLLWQVRPCDAASVFSLDAVFDWDYRDVLYDARRARTAIVAVACAQADDCCFCTSVGGGPGSTAGSDVLLTMTGRGAIAEVSTEKGEALLALSPELFTELPAGETKAEHLADVPQVFDGAPEGKNEGNVRFARVETAVGTVPGLRGLRLRVPHLFVLRHPGLRSIGRRDAFAVLGFLRSGALYPSYLGAQSAPDAGRALAAAYHAQVFLYSPAAKRFGLYRLRAVFARLSGGYEPERTPCFHFE